jgi:hypothetical protein
MLFTQVQKLFLDDGTISKVPTSEIFLASAMVCILLIILLFFIFKTLKPRTRGLKTLYQ